MDYFVFQCKDCGKFGAKGLRTKLRTAIYTCSYCRKSHKIKQKKMCGLSLYYYGPYPDARRAALICMVLNEKKGETNDFKTVERAKR